MGQRGRTGGPTVSANPWQGRSRKQPHTIAGELRVVASDGATASVPPLSPAQMATALRATPPQPSLDNNDAQRPSPLLQKERNISAFFQRSNWSRIEKRSPPIHGAEGMRRFGSCPQCTRCAWWWNRAQKMLGGVPKDGPDAVCAHCGWEIPSAASA